VRGKATFTQASSRAIRAKLLDLRRAERAAQKLIRASLRSMDFYISDWPRAATGFTRSDFDELVRTGRIGITG
jgi:hypothetical protein